MKASTFFQVAFLVVLGVGTFISGLWMINHPVAKVEEPYKLQFLSLPAPAPVRMPLSGEKMMEEEVFQHQADDLGLEPRYPQVQMVVEQNADGVVRYRIISVADDSYTLAEGISIPRSNPGRYATH